MIEQFFKPDSVEQALELKRRSRDEAVWFAGAANSMLHQPVPKIAISLRSGTGLG